MTLVFENQPAIRSARNIIIIHIPLISPMITEPFTEEPDINPLANPPKNVSTAIKIIGQMKFCISLGLIYGFPHILYKFQFFFYPVYLFPNSCMIFQTPIPVFFISYITVVYQGLNLFTSMEI